MLKRMVSSLKEKVESFKSKSKFEKDLYIATNNSYKNIPSTESLYYLSDFSKSKQHLILIFIKIIHRLKSKQNLKWKRISKTLKLVEFLLLNGSVNFLAIFIIQYMHLVEPYLNYEMIAINEDVGEKIRISAERIIYLCNHKDELKIKRANKEEEKKKFFKELDDDKFDLDNLPNKSDNYFEDTEEENFDDIINEINVKIDNIVNSEDEPDFLNV